MIIVSAGINLTINSSRLYSFLEDTQPCLLMVEQDLKANSFRAKT